MGVQILSSTISSFDRVAVGNCDYEISVYVAQLKLRHSIEPAKINAIIIPLNYSSLSITRCALSVTNQRDEKKKKKKNIGLVYASRGGTMLFSFFSA